MRRCLQGAVLLMGLVILPIGAGCEDFYGCMVFLFLFFLTVVMFVASISTHILQRRTKRWSQKNYKRFWKTIKNG